MIDFDAHKDNAKFVWLKNHTNVPRDFDAMMERIRKADARKEKEEGNE